MARGVSPVNSMVKAYLAANPNAQVDISGGIVETGKPYIPAHDAKHMAFLDILFPATSSELAKFLQKIYHDVEIMS